MKKFWNIALLGALLGSLLSVMGCGKPSVEEGPAVETPSRPDVAPGAKPEPSTRPDVK